MIVTNFRRARPLLCFFLALPVLAGCGGDALPSSSAGTPLPPPPPAPVSIFLGPTDATISVGSRLQFQPVTRISVAGWDWTVSDPGLATVSPAGLVEGHAAGLVRVRACATNSPHVCGVADLAIDAALATGAPAVSVAPGMAEAFVGQGIDFSATAAYFVAATWSWSTLDPLIATITAEGALTALRPGGVVVVACASSTPRYCGTAVVNVR